MEAETDPDPAHKYTEIRIQLKILHRSGSYSEFYTKPDLASNSTHTRIQLKIKNSSEFYNDPDPAQNFTQIRIHKCFVYG